MTVAAITRALAAPNGDPAPTADELAARLGLPRATVRSALAHLVFRAKTVTCDTQGRYRLGDPAALLGVKT